MDPNHWLESFTGFLVESNIINRDEVDKVREAHAQIDTRMGQLAELKGYLTPRDVMFIVIQQGNIKTRFGDVAVENGLMTERQIKDLVVRRDVQRIELAIAAFRQRNAGLPRALADLVSQSYLDALPLDPNGRDYQYDAVDGRVWSTAGRN